MKNIIISIIATIIYINIILSQKEFLNSYSSNLYIYYIIVALLEWGIIYFIYLINNNKFISIFIFAILEFILYIYTNWFEILLARLLVLYSWYIMYFLWKKYNFWVKILFHIILNIIISLWFVELYLIIAVWFFFIILNEKYNKILLLN